MTLIKLWRFGTRVGLIPTVACAAAWLVLGATSTLGIAKVLSPHPNLAWIVAILVALVVALVGLVSFWLVADLIEFSRRGYRVKWVDGNDWLYEERGVNGEKHFLPFVRVILGEGYPAPSEVHTLRDGSWNAEAPPWAHNRRTEILQRIARCLGAGKGGRIIFTELGDVAQQGAPPTAERAPK